MSSEKDVLIGAKCKEWNKTEDEVIEILYDKDEESGELELKDGAMDIILEYDSKRVARLREEANRGATEKFDQGYQKAQKEVLSKFEKELRDEFKIETDKQGKDLISEIISTASKGGDITEETLKTHPLYLKLEKSQKNAFDQQYQELKEEYEGFRSNIEREKALSGVLSKGRSAFMSLNPVLSDDKSKAEKQTQMFLNILKGYDYVPEGDTFVIKNGDTRLEDGHGNPLSFENFVKQKAGELFDFNVQQNRQGTGNQHQSAGGGSGDQFVGTRAEYNAEVARCSREKDTEGFKRLANPKITDK